MSFQMVIPGFFWEFSRHAGRRNSQILKCNPSVFQQGVVRALAPSAAEWKTSWFHQPPRREIAFIFVFSRVESPISKIGIKKSLRPHKNHKMCIKSWFQDFMFFFRCFHEIWALKKIIKISQPLKFFQRGIFSNNRKNERRKSEEVVQRSTEAVVSSEAEQEAVKWEATGPVTGMLLG